MTKQAVRVLLVDDQELIRSGLRRILRRRSGFEVVAECADGSEVTAALAEHEVDVVLMDLRMKNVDGVEATRRVRSDSANPPVLVLTTFDDDEMVSGALRAGAAGFVLKDTPSDDLLRAVRAVAAGDSWLDPSVTGRVLETYRRQPAAVAPPSLDSLTAREVEVLGAIGRGLSNGEIADALHISELTVKSHIGRIFTKLNLRDRAAAVVCAFETGLVSAGRSTTRWSSSGTRGALAEAAVETL